MDSSITVWLFALLLGLAGLYFMPKFGVKAIWRRMAMATERESTEDALKHLLVQRWDGLAASANTLKANLSLGDQQTLRLVNRMASQGLVMIQGGTLTLTPEGERLAIHITRAHRLLERYLADEARMPLKQIHKEAHHREHQISADEVDELDAFLGHPARDPHGDPIPDHSGSFREKVMKPLTLLGPGELGRVAHIEDEPVIAYAQIQAEGIFLGQTLRLVESTPERLVLTDGEGEFRLAPAIATNVHLEEVAQLSPQHELIPLHQLDGRQEAEIVKLDEACQGFTRRRFLDLGLTPGAAIYPELPNAFGDPRAYRIRGTLVALRKEQAEQIWVKPIDSTQKADALQKEMEN